MSKENCIREHALTARTKAHGRPEACPSKLIHAGNKASDAFVSRLTLLCQRGEAFAAMFIVGELVVRGAAGG